MVTSLAARGHEALVITRSEHRTMRLPPVDSYNGVPVHRFPIWEALANPQAYNFGALREEIAALRRAFAPDLVHLNSVGPSSAVELWTRGRNRTPTVATLHGSAHRSFPDSHLVRTVLQSVDWVVGVSDAILAEARASVPSIGARSSVIHNGMDLPALAPTPLPTDPPTVLFLGRLSPQKGFDLGIEAYALLAKNHPRVRLLIAGDGSDRAALSARCQELGIGHRVEFLGWVAPDAVPDVINRATVVALPSRWEPFGLVALEAAALARPVVASRVDGLLETVVHGVTGLLVPPADVAAFASALATLLDDVERGTKMGLTARARVQSEFNWNRCVAAYEDLYLALRNGGRTC